MKKIPHKAKHGNPMLNKINEKNREYYNAKLDIAIQMAFDASVLACNEVFQMGPGRFPKYAEEFKKSLNAISKLFAEDSNDMEYSKERLDNALLLITGPENHTPFDARYR